MRRIMAAMLMLLVIVSSITVGYAAEIEGGENLQPQHVGAANHSESITKGMGLKVNYSGTIVPKNATVLDKVVMTFKVRNYITDGIANQETVTVYYDETKNQFKGQGSCSVPTIGTYYLEVTYKCYKNGSLIDTIVDDTDPVSV